MEYFFDEQHNSDIKFFIIIEIRADFFGGYQLEHCIFIADLALCGAVLWIYLHHTYNYSIVSLFCGEGNAQVIQELDFWNCQGQNCNT